MTQSAPDRVECVQGAPRTDAAFCFDGTAVVRAIVFHLLDERLARAVAPESIRRTVERLTSKSFSASISRQIWAKMSNSRRLRWLLSESNTITLVTENNLMLLRARRSRKKVA